MRLWTKAEKLSPKAFELTSDRRILYSENINREQIAHGCVDQAGWAAKLGSPMYEVLLQRMADDVRDGGPCLVALEPHAALANAAPLLLLAAIHRMVLEGQLPEAARFYPSVGGQADVNGLWPHLLKAVPHAVLPVCVQT
ncbi:MAG: DUF2332 family protein [Bryobacteraceae bacterium]